MVSIKLLNYKIPLVLGFICYFVLISFFFFIRKLFEITRIRSVFKASAVRTYR